ncbi:HPF/RaiA family ribosome-associated protein [Candidatus Woesearchaeota archaeon]|nr:HPF/RaiA family ribosome-associated protein [Candidatus Woesearchaeota archaeon]
MEWSPVAGMVSEFIDYALFFVGIGIVYYIIRLVIGTGSKEEEQDRSERVRGWIKDKYQKVKDKEVRGQERLKKEKEVRARARLLQPAKGFIITAEEHAEHLYDAFNEPPPTALNDATRHLRQIEDNLRSAIRQFRTAKSHSKGDKRILIENMQNNAAAMLAHTVADIKKNMPASPTDPNWDTKKQNVRIQIGKMKGGCGILINAIDDFIDKDAATVPPCAP